MPEPSSSKGPSGFGGLKKPRWKLDSLPDLAGKVVMVTNPNNKVGKDTAKVLALFLVPATPLINKNGQALLYHNATVYIASSDIPKAEHTIIELRKETGKCPIFLHLDLGDRGSCESAAQLFLG